MDNQLSRRAEFMNPVALQQIDAMAKKFIDSKALPTTITNGSQLAMVLMAGYEAGMRPMESINAYYIVNGKITIWGSAVIQQLRKAGWEITWGESTDKIATVTITHKKRSEKATETYTIEEAQAAGLTGKTPWQKYPKSMLRHKAIAQAVRFTCPEVLGGFYMKEDIDGSVLDVEATEKTVETKKLPEKFNKAIHASWNELAELKGWSTEQAEGARKKTLAKLYSAESNNDLSIQQAGEFLTKIADQIKELRAAEPADKPEDDTKGGNEDEQAEAVAGDAGEDVIEAEVVEDKISSEDFVEIGELAVKAGMDSAEMTEYFERLYKCTLETLPTTAIKGVKSALKRRATMNAQKDAEEVSPEDVAKAFGGEVID